MFNRCKNHCNEKIGYCTQIPNIFFLNILFYLNFQRCLPVSCYRKATELNCFLVLRCNIFKDCRSNIEVIMKN